MNVSVTRWVFTILITKMGVGLSVTSHVFYNFGNLETEWKFPTWKQRGNHEELTLVFLKYQLNILFDIIAFVVYIFYLSLIVFYPIFSRRNPKTEFPNRNSQDRFPYRVESLVTNSPDREFENSHRLSCLSCFFSLICGSNW